MRKTKIIDISLSDVLGKRERIILYELLLHSDKEVIHKLAQQFHVTDSMICHIAAKILIELKEGIDELQTESN